MGAFIFILLILVFAGICVWQFIETRNALATTSVLTRHTPDQTAQIIETAFGGARSVLWTNERGPGTINKRRRGYKRGITMSIDISSSDRTRGSGCLAVDGISTPASAHATGMMMH